MDKTNLQGLAEVSGWILFSCIKTANICKKEKSISEETDWEEKLIKSMKGQRKQVCALFQKYTALF